jgi:hypothetical protein
MTVAEILEQAKALSLEERKELLRLLIEWDMSTESQLTDEEHWGQSMLRLLDEI